MKNIEKISREKIFIENARIEAIESYPGEQFIFRIKSPKCAQNSIPGNFIHITCDKKIPMRRPLSIMRANAEQGWIEILFKIVGDGLQALSKKEIGDILNSMGPIGNGFKLSPNRPKIILIGGGVGIPPVIFLAETLKNNLKSLQPIVFMGSEIPFPFETAETTMSNRWLPKNINHTMPLLESWGIPGVLSSLSNFTGTYRGYVHEVVDKYLSSLPKEDLSKIQMFSCGPTPMLKEVSYIASKYHLPCQIALEEYMACAVGGCAGCAVMIHTQEGKSMKRVCVDGPVFEASSVFPAV